MTCEHPAAELLPERVIGALGDADAKSVEEHLQTCADCRARATTLVWIREIGRERGPALFEGHASADDLLAWSAGSPPLPDAQRRAVEAHLELCRTCAEEVEVLRAVNADLGGHGPTAPRPVSGPSLRARLASWIRGGGGSPVPAYALVALLLIPATAGIRHWTSGAGAPEAPAAAPAIRTADSPVVLRSGARRAAEAVPTVAPASDGSCTVLLSAPVSGEAGRFDLELFGPDGARIWSRPDVESIDRFGTFVVFLPPDALTAGPHAFVLREVGAAEDPGFSSFRFEFLFPEAR